MADVSIVVVHWNVPDLLDACLRSLAAECARSSLSVETIVVDVASPSQAHQEVCERWGAELAQLAENRGYAAGCNAGIARATGKSVLLLNADIEALPGCLEALHGVLRVARHVGTAAPMLLNADMSVQSAGYRFPGVANVAFDLFPAPGRLRESSLNGRAKVGDGVQPIRIDYPLGAAMLVKREAIEDVGPLDEGYGMYCEEIDWARRFAERGWTTLLAPRARMIHHGGSSTSQRADEMREALWRSRARYYARWGTDRQRRLIAALVRVGTLLDDARTRGRRRASNTRIRGFFGADGPGA